mmetsp:Transcript_22575/g.76216  ORF Transcript_22575/g.76216 Transcript_22575/m.76216 type:complete len:274 (+) Transcript_22575:296-1117(+)
MSSPRAPSGVERRRRHEPSRRDATARARWRSVESSDRISGGSGCSTPPTASAIRSRGRRAFTNTMAARRDGSSRLSRTRSAATRRGVSQTATRWRSCSGTGCSGCEWMSIGSVPHQRCATACLTKWFRCGSDAETKRVWRGSGPQRAASTCSSAARVSGALSAASTSSTTSVRSEPSCSRPEERSASTCCTLPTITCGGCARIHTRCRRAADPSSRAITSGRSGLPAASLRATRATWAASSREGASTSACTDALGRREASSGSMYASVLPEPV